MTGTRRLVLGVAIVTALWADAAQAQVIGTFRWQLLPYCNVVTLTVVQTGSVYALQGSDDQCGSGGAGVTGVAFPQPSSQITIAFDTGYSAFSTSVTPIHTEATITLANLGGTWKDSLGNNGTLTFTPGAAAPSGTRRPLTRVLGLGSLATTVTVAANSCIVRDNTDPSVAAGDLVVAYPETLPAGMHLVPVIAGANGRYGVMYCNGTPFPMNSVSASVVLLREPR